MSPTPVFVLDANVLIDAAKRYYAFDLTPAFWDQLVAHGNAGRLCTIRRIADEIGFPDELKAWIDSAFRGSVKDSGTPETLSHYAALMQWAQGQPFTDAARNEFAAVADAWLVAYAKAIGGTVVTHETYDANCKRRVKIPNACRFVGVPYADTFVMLRTLGIRPG